MHVFILTSRKAPGQPIRVLTVISVITDVIVAVDDVIDAAEEELAASYPIYRVEFGEEPEYTGEYVRVMDGTYTFIPAQEPQSVFEAPTIFESLQMSSIATFSG